jgi:hypothetical protein
MTQSKQQTQQTNKQTDIKESTHTHTHEKRKKEHLFALEKTPPPTHPPPKKKDLSECELSGGWRHPVEPPPHCENVFEPIGMYR